MTLRCQVTFEFETLPLATWRGIVRAGGPQTCASRALSAARKELRPTNWRSFVIVCLERLPETREPSGAMSMRG